MLKKLQWKLVAIIMAVVGSTLVLLCGVLVVSTMDSLRNQSVSLLNRVINQDNGLWAQNDTQKDWDAFRKGGVSLPYFTVVVAADGSAYIVNSQFYDLSDTDALETVVTDCLSLEESQGVMAAYSLRYLREEGPFGWRIAFVDITQSTKTLEDIMWHALILCLLALTGLFFLSVFLAKWAVRPVERSWKQQRQFVADASHELKTPLTVVLSNVEMLQGYGAGLSDKERGWLDNIHVSSEQMRALLEEMLTLARADSVSGTEIAQVHKALNFSDLVMDEVLMFEPMLFEAGKELLDDVDEGWTVTGDEQKLKRLIDVLLDNARKYAADGGVVTVRLKPEGTKRVCLSVTNEGDPIPQEQLTRIFERFYRADAARTSEGFGLGLSIAQQIAQEHGGTLWAESDLEQGNTFRFSLPGQMTEQKESKSGK